jgi:hypothetical protein
MNLSAENMGRIRDLVEGGFPLKASEIEDLHGHNDHLTQLLEARFRLMLGAETERDQLKAEVARSTEREIMQLAEIEALRKALIDVRDAVQREYWDEYAGLDETRGILDAAIGKEAQL